MPTVSAEQVRLAGVVGAGGAGFPTHVKLSARADALLLNAAECEPLLHKDKEVLRCFTEEVIAGVAAAMQLTGAGRAVIGVKEKYREVIEHVRPRLGPGMELFPLRDSYPAGDEFVLVFDALGRVIPPGRLPLDVGAVVINVETAMNIALAPGQPVTEKFLTIGGAVADPVTLRVPIGATLRQCVEAAGGPTVPDANYLVGGVMMGLLEHDHDAPVTRTTGGVIVLGDDHVVVRRRRQDWRQIVRIGRSACDQCSFCTELCPRYLLGHPIEPHRAMRSLQFNLVGEANTAGTRFCCECNLCSLYACPEDLDPKNVCTTNKRRIAEAADVWQDPPFNPDRPAALLNDRKIPMAALILRLGLNGFRNVGELSERAVATDRVAIPLRQHIGAACEPAVTVGERVKRGQEIGRVPVVDGRPALGVPVHASIDGTVTGVEDGMVRIER